MNRTISKIRAINLILLLSILNGNILSMQKSNVPISQDVQQDLSKDELNKRLRYILHSFPINRNDLGEAVKLILAGANVNEKNNNIGNTALVLAAEHGHKDIVQLFIDNGANVNEKNNYGVTALMYAVISGYKKIVQLLINNGANVNQMNNEGDTALMLAVKNGYKDVVQLLIDNYANVNQRNKFGATALMLAVKNDHEGIVELLEAAKNKENQNN